MSVHPKLWNMRRKRIKLQIKNAKLNRMPKWRREAIDSLQRWSKSYSNKIVSTRSLSREKGALSTTTKLREMKQRREKILRMI